MDIVLFENLSINETGSHLVGAASDSRSYVENSVVSESLSLMKFYSLSSGVVNHLLSDRDGSELDLPSEVTDEETKIILYNRSSFVLGRSGTGKTTALTMKLFQKEKLHHMALEGLYGVNSKVKENSVATKRTVLRQLFVTISPELCYPVKQHVSRLKRCVEYTNKWLHM